MKNNQSWLKYNINNFDQNIMPNKVHALQHFFFTFFVISCLQMRMIAQILTHVYMAEMWIWLGHMYAYVNYLIMDLHVTSKA